jgi:hypothetical protein
MDYTKRKELEYKATKQLVRSKLDKEIRFSLANKTVYEDVGIADFLSPAIRNLGLLGGVAGSLKGALEPAIDDIGMPISGTQRLGNIATNAIGGGLAGAGVGMGYKAFRPGIQRAANSVADTVTEIPGAIEGKQGLLSKIQNVANSDLVPKAPSPVANTVQGVVARGKRDLQKVDRFVTGRGAALEQAASRPVGKTIVTIDPVTNAQTQQFIPKVDKFGDPIMETVGSARVNPNAVIDPVTGLEKTTRSVGAVTGAVPGAVIGGTVAGPVGAVAGAGIGAVAGSKTGRAIGQSISNVAGQAKDGTLGAALGARAAQDWEKTKRGGQYLRAMLPFAEGGNRTVNFMSPSSQTYRNGALLGAGAGTILGGINEVANTRNRQDIRNQQEMDDIMSISNPYVRQGTYRDYTSPDNTMLRNVRDTGDVVARGALGALVGGGAGLGLGGLVSTQMSKPAKSSGLLGKVRG